ncbi:hypothetical protein FJTKL_04096 [Diaporthe vaccinii]|uniref:Uncharacterized protein n=1 Tax=Diaporthe vaccinii TaxID=105482 RepID=A0ABR4DTT1_9PEZI
MVHAGPRNLPRPHPRPARRLSFCPASPPRSLSLSACLPCAPRPARSFILTSSRPSLRPRSPLLSSLPLSTHPTLLCKSTKTKALAFDLCLPLVPGHSLTPSFVFPLQDNPVNTNPHSFEPPNNNTHSHLEA